MESSRSEAAGRPEELVQNGRTVQTFRFTSEHGRRLRGLRERAGLGLVELGHVMGRRPGFQSHLRLLETGRLPYPSLALVADYLRACRASFYDLLPVLSSYTNKAPVRETRVRERVVAELKPLGGMEAVRLKKYDRKVGVSQKPEARVRAARKQAGAAAERRLLDSLMRKEVNRLGVEPTFVVRKVAVDYARMVWKALQLTTASQKAEAKTVNAEGGERRGRPSKTRVQRLADARARFLELAPGILPDRAMKHVEGRVVALYEDVHRLEKRKQ